jgi:transposase-like protein
MVRPDRERLSDVVEVDETYLGGEKPGKRGRGASGKALVVVATEVKGDHIGRIRLRRVSDASAISLGNAVKEAVKPSSVVRTDGWRGYAPLEQMGYRHEIVREETEVGSNLLPKVNRVVALLKRWFLGVHQGAVGYSYLDYYLDEFTFRFNRRTSQWRGKLFYRLMQQAVGVS